MCFRVVGVCSRPTISDPVCAEMAEYALRLQQRADSTVSTVSTVSDADAASYRRDTGLMGGDALQVWVSALVRLRGARGTGRGAPDRFSQRVFGVPVVPVRACCAPTWYG